jgi:hypothetical protein
MTGAKFAGNALHENLAAGFYENGHFSGIGM